MRRVLSAILGILLAFAFLGIGTVPAEIEIISITDRAGLEAIRDYPGAAYRLDADIDLSDAPWIPIPLFSGVLDGNGYSLYNIYIESAGEALRSVYSSGQRHTEFPSVFSGFFACIEDAEIRDLALLNLCIDLQIDNSCFAGGLAGYAWQSTVSGCLIEARVRLVSSGKAAGAAGLIGCGFADLTNNTVYADVTLLDTGGETHSGAHAGVLLSEGGCEQYGGGLMAYGYGRIRDNRVHAQLWTAVDGFAHNGLLMGIWFVYTFDPGVTNIDIEGNVTGGDIYYLERVPPGHTGHAYTSAFCGEPHPPRGSKYTVAEWANKIRYRNSFENYQRHRLTEIAEPFGPEQCAAPDYSAEIFESSCTEFGYTQYTCTGCAYSYKTYMRPRHSFAESRVETSYTEGGYVSGVCTLCGYSAILSEWPALTPAPTAPAPTEEPDSGGEETDDIGGGTWNPVLLWLLVLIPVALLAGGWLIYRPLTVERLFNKLRRLSVYDWPFGLLHPIGLFPVHVKGLF
ncbi:MAG: hypothetical protein FWF10_00855 [Clostridiales bacterium]|nr:hypothetical protein [Clostridiales bacterium]